MLASPREEAQSQAGGGDVPAFRPPQPSALLAIDQNRATVVERIIVVWGDALAHANAGVDAEQLRSMLTGMRADHLLAASLAGSLDGLRNAIATAVLSEHAPVSAALLRAKSLGDAADDLVYTPVVPCRLADTRVAGGAIAANTTRNFKVWVASGGFTAQGGDGGNCNVPANPAAVVLNFAAVNPGGIGNLIAYPTGGSLPNTSVLNYQNGTYALSNGAIVPACVPNCANQVSVKANGAALDVVMDIVGYFKPALSSSGSFQVNVGGTLALRIDPDATSPLVIAGSSANTVTAGASGAAIGGGGATVASLFGQPCGSCANRVTDAFGTVAGGAANQAGDGAGTAVDRPFATVGGGFQNAATGSYSTIAGGSRNSVSGDSSAILGGFDNTVDGSSSAVMGGSQNTVSGNNSVAAGLRAYADHDGCAVFGFWSTTYPFSCLGVAHIFRLGADHGFSVDYYSQRFADGGGNRWVYIGDVFAGNTISTWMGASLTDGGAWTNASDRNRKENFARIDPEDILARVIALPVTQWNYRAEPGVKRIGPVAQDFHAAFGLGGDDKTISTVDESGVALAAIQGLYRLVREKEAQLERQTLEITALKGDLATIKARLEMK